MTLTEFLLARIDEDEAVARAVREQVKHGHFEDAAGSAMTIYFDSDYLQGGVNVSTDRVLAECEAKRRIVEFHKSWPVLVETPPTFETDASDPSSMTMRMSKQIAWTTEQKYREHFGTEPPSGPIVRALAAVYADHPDYREEWRL